MGLAQRVLVTGGAGFIGSHLCESLLRDGHSVVAVDNFLTGTVGNVEHLLAHAGFELREGDVCDPFPTNLRVDQIYNLACPASPVHYQRDPIRTTKTCVMGAINVLELALRCDARVLQASTSEVYGDPEVHPQTEDYRGAVDPTSVRSCYDEGKRCAETLFFDYQRQHGTDIKIARIFNTYGPRMHPNDGRVVSNFVVQALQNHPITVFGRGEQTRSFMYVSDLVHGLRRTMQSRAEAVGPFNLGVTDERTVLELAELVLELTGSSSDVVFEGLPADDPRRRRPDISRAKAQLNWQPTVGLRDGLRETIAYFRQQLNVARADSEHAYAVNLS